MPGDDCAELSLSQGSISATREWDITITQVVCPGQLTEISLGINPHPPSFRCGRATPGVRPVSHGGDGNCV